MGLFSREPTSADVTAEHTIAIRVSPAAGPSGTATDMASIATLEDRLIEAITHARAGEFDGNEFTGSDVYFYAYGPDGDRLLEAVRGPLRDFPAPCHVMLRYGPYHDEQAPTTVVEL